MPNGDIVGGIQEKILTEINVESSSFTFTKPDALQTELLNTGVVGPYRIGYDTNAWEA